MIHDEVPIPADLLRPTFPFKQLFGEENTLGETEQAEWITAVQQMASTARAHLAEAKELQPQIPRAAKPAVLLPMVPSLQFLERLEAAQHNLMDAKLHEPLNLQLMLRLGRSWLSGRV